MGFIAIKDDRDYEREFLMFLFSYEVAYRLRDEHDLRLSVVGGAGHQPDWEVRTPLIGDPGLMCRKCGHPVKDTITAQFLHNVIHRDEDGRMFPSIFGEKKKK